MERYGSHTLNCSVAKQSLTALSSGEAEFYGIVRAVATSKHTSQILEQIGMQLEVTIASDSSAARGICTRTGSGKGAPFDQSVVDTGSVSQEGVPVGVGGHDVELGRHWNESTHVGAPDVVAEADVTSPERGSDKGVGMSHIEGRRKPCKPRRGWRRS